MLIKRSLFWTKKIFFLILLYTKSFIKYVLSANIQALYMCTCICNNLFVCFFTEIGLLNYTGVKSFMTLFNLKKRKANSLAFAVDVSGSMGSEINDVREICLQKVTSVIGTSNEPTNYVLTTFSDPGRFCGICFAKC